MAVFFQDKIAEILPGKTLFSSRKIIETYDGNGDGIC